jgi:hypothetical protein
MTEPVDLPQLDEPPRSGVFLDHDDLELTAAEIAEGKRLGETIDPDDDTDSGLD